MTPSIFDTVAVICYWLMWLSVGGLAMIAVVAFRMLGDDDADTPAEG